MTTANTAIGCRVHIFSADQQEDLGFGTYLGDESMPSWTNELAKQLFDTDIAGATMPKLQLNSGKVLYGYECWWYPVDDAGEPI